MKTRSALAALSFLLPHIVVLAQGTASVPPPKSQEELRKQSKGEVPKGLEAANVIADVKSNMNTIPSIADAVTGERYGKFLGPYGKVFDGVKIGTEIAGGYYRGGNDGMVAAEKGVLIDLAAKGAIGFGAGVVSGVTGVALAPLVAAGEGGYALGSGINAIAGNQITQGMYAGQDFYFDVKDKYIDEPARQKWGEELRAKHQAAKAQYESEAAVRAQQPYDSSAAPMSGGVEMPMIAAPQPVSMYRAAPSQAQPNPCGSSGCGATSGGYAGAVTPLKFSSPPPSISTPPVPLPSAIHSASSLDKPTRQLPAPSADHSRPVPAPSADHSASGPHKPDGYCKVVHNAGQCPHGQM